MLLVSFLSNKAQYLGGAVQFLFNFVPPADYENVIWSGNIAARGNDISTIRPVAVYLREYELLVDTMIDELTNLTEWILNKSKTVINFDIE